VGGKPRHLLVGVGGHNDSSLKKAGYGERSDLSSFVCILVVNLTACSGDVSEPGR